MNQKRRVPILLGMMVFIVCVVSFTIMGFFIVQFRIPPNLLMLIPIVVVSCVLTFSLYARFVPAYKRLNRYFVLERLDNQAKTVSLSHEAHWWLFHSRPLAYGRQSMDAIHEFIARKSELEKDGIEYIEAKSMIFKFDGLPVEKVEAKPVRYGILIIHLSNVYNWTWKRLIPEIKEINKIRVTLDEFETWYRARYARS